MNLIKKIYNKLKKVSNRMVLISLLISLLLHMAAMFWHLELEERTFLSGDSKQKSIKVHLLADGKDNQKKSNERKQIVNTEEKQLEQRPSDSRFLGKKDQTFNRQTVAKIVDKFQMAGKGQKDGSRKIVQKRPKKAHVQKRKKKKVHKLGQKRIKLSDLAVTGENIAKNEVPENVNLSALGLRNGKMNKSGLSQNNDFVEDVPLGDMTKLNVAEFKYFGFFDRIRKKLEQFWGRSLQEKADILMKKGRRIPANSNKITALTVTLDANGNIIDVYIKTTSGVKELDEAAVESFNNAGPFPNPPKGMIRNGITKIEWGFVVKS